LAASGTGITALIGALGPAVAVFVAVATFAAQRHFERRRDERLAREEVDKHVQVLRAVVANIRNDLGSLGRALDPALQKDSRYWLSTSSGAVSTLEIGADTIAKLDLGGINNVAVWRALLILRVKLRSTHIGIELFHEHALNALKGGEAVSGPYLQLTSAALHKVADFATALLDVIGQAYPHLRSGTGGMRAEA
jgi:hypothetical protein